MLMLMSVTYLIYIIIFRFPLGEEGGSDRGRSSGSFN